MEFLYPRKTIKIVILGMDGKPKAQPEVRWETKLGEFTFFADLEQGEEGQKSISN